MQNLAVGIWIATVCLAPVQAALAQSCPNDIRSGWETEVPLKALFEIKIELEMGADGNYAGRLISSSRDQ